MSPPHGGPIGMPTPGQGLVSGNDGYLRGKAKAAWPGGGNVPDDVFGTLGVPDASLGTCGAGSGTAS